MNDYGKLTGSSVMSFKKNKGDIKSAFFSTCLIVTIAIVVLIVLKAKGVI